MQTVIALIVSHRHTRVGMSAIVAANVHAGPALGAVILARFIEMPALGAGEFFAGITHFEKNIYGSGAPESHERYRVPRAPALAKSQTRTNRPP